MATKLMTATTETPDESIAEAEAALLAANAMWRSLPMPIKIDLHRAPENYRPDSRIGKLTAGVATDQALLRLESLKRDREQAELLQLVDSRSLAALEDAAAAAKLVFAEAEAQALEARAAHASVTSALDGRQRRSAELQKLLAERDSAITAAQASIAKAELELVALEQFSEYRTAVLAGRAGAQSAGA